MPTEDWPVFRPVIPVRALLRDDRKGDRIRTSITAALGLALLCLIATTDAQQAKVYRVAFVSAVAPLSELTGPEPLSPFARAFVRALRDFGYVEGGNLILDWRSLDGKLERLEQVVSDVVRLKPDVIFIPADRLAQRALKVTGTVPIVMFAARDVVAMGLVHSLARPGGTVTGMIVDVDMGVEAKRLELLLEAVPKVRRVAYLGSQEAWDSDWGKHMFAAAQRLGLELFIARATAANYTDAFAHIKRARPDAVYVPTGPVPYGHRQEIGQFLTSNRMPSTCAESEFVELGCLMSYGTTTADRGRVIARYVDSILKGAKPGDLPIERPTRFELIVNLKTARQIGVTIPQSVLVRADRVIE